MSPDAALVVCPLDGGEAAWRSESDAPPPRAVSRVDDRLTADAAVARARRGEYLLYQGDFRNARQLVAAMGRRVGRQRQGRAQTPLETFRAERLQRLREHETLSRVLVQLDPAYRWVGMSHAPDVAQVCRAVWGPATLPTLVPLKALLGMLGAEEWRKKGVVVKGLRGRLHPAYGVFSPTRTEYLDLVLEAPAPRGKRVFDVGTGTGVLAFLLLERGAASAVGTDVDGRAVACAMDNAARLGLSQRFEARLGPLFPDGQADLVVCNPPWIPEPWKNRIDRAVYDEDHVFLDGFLSGLKDHLAPGGEAWLLLSNLPELLGLRPEGFLAQRFVDAGLRVKWTRAGRARHKKATDADDPLHAARAREVTTLYCLASA